MSWVVFGGVAATMLTGAVQVARSDDLVHAIFWLAFTLVGTAAGFAMMQADLIAVLQVMLYTGGVVTLMLFSVLLTRRLDSARASVASVGTSSGLFVAIGFAVLVLPAVFTSALPDGTPAIADSAAVAESFLTRHLIAFEALSVLLLAAMIGAIVIARRKDWGGEW